MHAVVPNYSVLTHIMMFCCAVHRVQQAVADLHAAAEQQLDPLLPPEVPPSKRRKGVAANNDDDDDGELTTAQKAQLIQQFRSFMEKFGTCNDVAELSSGPVYVRHDETEAQRQRAADESLQRLREAGE